MCHFLFHRNTSSIFFCKTGRLLRRCRDWSNLFRLFHRIRLIIKSRSPLMTLSQIFLPCSFVQPHSMTSDYIAPNIVINWLTRGDGFYTYDTFSSASHWLASPSFIGGPIVKKCLHAAKEGRCKIFASQQNRLYFIVLILVSYHTFDNFILK